MMEAEQIRSWLETFAGREHLWIIEVFIVVLATLTVALVAKHFLDRLAQRAELSPNLWDDALANSIRRPLRWFIWIVGLAYAARITAAHTDSAIFDAIDTLRHVAIIGIVSWFLVSFIGYAERNLMDPRYARKPLDKTTAMALGRLLRISVLITAVLVAMQSMGYSISGVLAFGGIGGIAVGFAAKDLLANFFGGLMIYLDRPFAVGDWIRSPDRELEGTVEDIGWRLTRIRTFDQRPLYIPNSVFTHVAVENPSRMLNRRIYENIGIRYDDAKRMRLIVDDVRAMLVAHEDIDTQKTLIVNFNGYGASSLDFMVYCFTKTVNWVEYHQVKEKVLLRILDIIESHGAECAFPTTTLHVPNPVHIEAENNDPVRGS
jgi:MscS family membrane protein